MDAPMPHLFTYLICSEFVQRILMLRGVEAKADSFLCFEYYYALEMMHSKEKSILYLNINEK